LLRAIWLLLRTTNDATNQADDAADETVDNPTGDGRALPPASIREASTNRPELETDDARDG